MYIRISSAFASLVIGLGMLFQAERSRGQEPFDPNYKPALEEIVMDAPDANVVVKGVRYSHPGRQPVLVIHGYTGNTRSHKELGAHLHRNGYDVWMINLRHHGNGSHQTRVKKYFRGAYKFEHMVCEDLPLAIEHIHRHTGKRLHVIGYSMGGMAALNLAKGYRYSRDPQGRALYDQVIFDPEYAKWLARERVSKIVALAAPTHFHNLTSFAKIFALLTPREAAYVLGVTSWVKKNRAPTEPDPSGRLAAVDRKLRQVALDRLKTLIPRGVWNVRHSELEEIYAYFEKSLSTPHGDLNKQFHDGARSGRMMDGKKKIDFSDLHPIYVDDVLMVAGEYDELAPARVVKDSASELSVLRSREHLKPVAFSEVRTASHWEVASGRVSAETSGDQMIRFFEGRPVDLHVYPRTCRPTVPKVIALLQKWARR